MAKVTAQGSRRSYTGATFGGSTRVASLHAERSAQKIRQAKERKALADKNAVVERFVERMKIGRLLDKRLLARLKLSQPAAGSQLGEALAAAFNKKPES